jgi:hypothetical protein
MSTPTVAQCVGPEFTPDPTTGQLRFKGAGSKPWPPQGPGIPDVFTPPENNGLLYDPVNGGLYTAPHGAYRQWLRETFTGPAVLNRGISQPTAPGGTWQNPTLGTPLTFTNPSLAQACSVQWTVSFWASVSVPVGNQLVHWIGTDTAQLDRSGCLPAGSVANAPNSGYDMGQYPWSDDRTSMGIALVAPGGTLTVWAAQFVTTAAWGPQATTTPFAVLSAGVEWILEGFLVDANQAGGTVVQQ